jgi:hypothetical protein
MQKKQIGAKFTEGNPKSALDWEIYRGKQLPGPAAYYPTASHKQKLQMEKDSRIAARARADEVQAETLAKANAREMARLEARTSSQSAVAVGPNDAAVPAPADLGNFVPA